MSQLNLESEEIAVMRREKNLKLKDIKSSCPLYASGSVFSWWIWIRISAELSESGRFGVLLENKII